MADRGRKAFPVSSHVCDERWQRHCMDLHKQRLAEMKHQVDTKQPETFDIQLSKGKRAMLEKERQFEIDRENAILLQKMVRIKEQDTRAVFRPWTARSTFQWKLGHYYDPTTGTKTLDHINLTSASSPRSIHYYSVTRPGTAPPDVTARLRDMQIQTDNTKLLRAITTMRSRYSVDDLERRHAEESVLVNRISNFRGPETARYQPPGRSSSTSRRSPYLAGQPPSRGGSRRSLPTGGSHASLQRYYEEAQSRDLPPSYSPRSTGGSRPGTAAVAPSQQGLGETTPRSRGGSGSGKGSPLGSVYGSRPESASQRPPFGSAQGRSFSFDQRQREQEDQERQRQAREEAAAGSGDEYADEQYERDEQEEDARSARAEEEEEGARASASGSRQAEEEEEGGDGYGEEGFEPDGEAGDQEEEEEAEEEQQQDEEEARASASGAYGDEEEEQQAGGDEEEAAGYGFQQDEEQGQEEAEEQVDGGDGDAAGSPRGSTAGDDDGAEAAGAAGEEEQGQEEGYGDGYEQEEADQNGAADEEGKAEEAGGDGDDGVAAGDDDGGVGASGEEDLAAYALPAATPVDDDAADSAGQQSLKVGGFAADWD